MIKEIKYNRITDKLNQYLKTLKPYTFSSNGSLHYYDIVPHDVVYIRCHTLEVFISTFVYNKYFENIEEYMYSMMIKEFLINGNKHIDFNKYTFSWMN